MLQRVLLLTNLRRHCFCLITQREGELGDQWRSQGRGRVAHPQYTPLFLDQTEARRAEKTFFGECPPPAPPYLRVWMTTPHISQVVGDEAKMAARETSHRLVIQDCEDSQRALQKQEILPDNLIMYQISPGYVCSVWQTIQRCKTSG